MTSKVHQLRPNSAGTPPEVPEPIAAFRNKVRTEDDMVAYFFEMGRHGATHGIDMSGLRGRPRLVVMIPWCDAPDDQMCVLEAMVAAQGHDIRTMRTRALGDLGAHLLGCTPEFAFRSEIIQDTDDEGTQEIRQALIAALDRGFADGGHNNVAAVG